MAEDGDAQQAGNQKVVIFDGDDTLWDDQGFYDKAYGKFKETMEGLGFDPERSVSELRRTSLKNVKTMGLSPSRFPTSMVETYRAMCAEIGAAPDKGTEATLYGIGAAVFEEERTLYPGVTDTLEKLRDAGYRLILLTAGDNLVQEFKVRTLGLRNLFDEIIIVPVKDTVVYTKLVKEHGLNAENTFMVGNSLKSDILPALEAGLSAIHVPGHAWAYDKEVDTARLQAFGSRFNTIDSITKVVALLDASKVQKKSAIY